MEQIKIGDLVGFYKIINNEYIKDKHQTPYEVIALKGITNGYYFAKEYNCVVRRLSDGEKCYTNTKILFHLKDKFKPIQIQFTLFYEDEEGD